MKKPLLYILPFLLLSSLALAEEEWTVRTTKNFVDVCIPGQITHGDTSCFSMKKGNCDVLEHYFSVYTKSGHKNILEMQGKILPIESLGTVIGARVLFSAPFLSGHRVILSVNQHPVNQYLDFLKEFETFDAKIIDSEDGSFIAKDYFDIQHNTWSLQNLDKAIKEGQQVCKETDSSKKEDKTTKPPPPAKDVTAESEDKTQEPFSSSLPECEGSPATDTSRTLDTGLTSKWTNCYGTHALTDDSYKSVGKYVGEWKDGKYHGQGTWTTENIENGVVVRGIWKDGKILHRQETETPPPPKDAVAESEDKTKKLSSSSLPKCEGSPATDRAVSKKWTNCFGTFTFPAGHKYVGEWKDGKPHGQGTQTLADGFKYVGEWKDGKPHGQGTTALPSGGKYVGEFKDGKMHGQGTITYPSGKRYVGEWKDGQQHGQGAEVYPDGKVVKGIWKDDELFEVQ